jgi:RNA polymerase sigma-70 factor (ECF subfamily)
MDSGGDVRLRVPSDKATPPDDARTRTDALYSTYRDAIYGFLVAHGLSHAVAQDVTQDVFVDLFVALQKGTQLNSERAWLYTVASRAAVDHTRHARASMWTELDSPHRGIAFDFPSDAESPEVEAVHRQRLGQVASGLQTLSRKDRLCFELRMQGLSYREIGERMNVSTSAVAERLLSVIDQLRDKAK